MTNAVPGKESPAEKAARIAILSKVVHQESYMKNAIQRMAAVMSRYLVEDTEGERKC